ncbi:MAG TPA: ABC transporter permease [Candidatus Bathyarchaeia archaeon]|nr:ABC transporter permease [Candidatus Bathyarchaeia archaeon]
MTLLQELDKIYFFMKRDILSFSTYKTNILLSILSALFGALSYAFLGANAKMQVLETYHTDLTTYLIIGLAFNTYLSQSLTLVQRTINPWSLEEVLVSPTGLVTFIVGSSLWGFIWSTGVIAIYLAVGIFAFGVVLSVNIIGTVLVVALGIATFIGFSMIGAGILILTKQGDPVTTVITIATNLFGNVLFPPQVMPEALRVISYFVPQYYFFTTIREVLTGSSLQAILPDLLILIAMCAIILPLGYLAYSWCLRTAKKNGTLSWF